ILCGDQYWLANRGGFNPPVQLLTVQRFSKPPPSATRPPLRRVRGRAPSLDQKQFIITCPRVLCHVTGDVCAAVWISLTHCHHRADSLQYDGSRSYGKVKRASIRRGQS